MIDSRSTKRCKWVRVMAAHLLPATNLTSTAFDLKVFLLCERRYELMEFST
jgi:hypothetical protein